MKAHFPGCSRTKWSTACQTSCCGRSSTTTIGPAGGRALLTEPLTRQYASISFCCCFASSNMQLASEKKSGASTSARYRIRASLTLRRSLLECGREGCGHVLLQASDTLDHERAAVFPV